MAAGVFDLQSSHNPYRYHLPVVRQISVGAPDRMFMFGGVGLGAAIEALQNASGRSVVWATAQYLDFARPGSTVDFDVRIPVTGRFNSQGRVIGHVNDAEIIVVTAALGHRPDPYRGQWLQRPDVPEPLTCPIIGDTISPPGSLMDQFERRLARGRMGGLGGAMDGPDASGQVCMWIRAVHGAPIGGPMLAVVADYVVGASSHAMGRQVNGNSLDNTIRYTGTGHHEWVLCDMHMQAAFGGAGHATMYIYAPDGLLLAIASQSFILRYGSGRPTGESE